MSSQTTAKLIDRFRRTARPPMAHEWQEYMDGEVRCAACGKRRRPGIVYGCRGAAKVTIDVE